jgi:hypothetical protein
VVRSQEWSSKRARARSTSGSVTVVQCRSASMDVLVEVEAFAVLD